MRTRTRKLEETIFTLLFVAVFFDAYCITYIGSYPVTVFTVASVIFIFIRFINSIRLYIAFGKADLVALVFIFYIVFDCIVTLTMNVTSVAFSCYFLLLFIFSHFKTDEKFFYKIVSIYKKIVDAMAIYGIYQFVGRMVNLPFSDLIISGHMVKGFNWSNQISIAGHAFYRSNAIFREPSFFSQFLAINILLYFAELLKSSGRNIKYILLNVVALVLTFSGTGFLLLFSAGIIYIYRVKKNKRVKKWLRCSFVVVGILFLFIIQTSVGKYFILRLMEVFKYNPNNFSGYVRFRSGFDILKEAWKKNFIFGIGIGTIEEFIASIPNYYEGMTANGFYRPAIELGLIGMILWLLLIGISSRKEQYIDNSMLVIKSILIPMMFCHEVFQSNFYWIFVCFIHIKYYKDRLIS